MKTYDFRSDTVTRPSPAMREVMAAAEVGDDVYGEDPTVNALQEKAAAMMGKEAGLFVSSGTLGNLLAVLAVCQRGDEVIMGRQGHTFLHEAGGVSALGGVMVNTIPNQADGTMSLEDLAGAVRFPDIHEPPSRMVIIENTQNACGGMALDVEYTQKVGEFARKNNLYFHIDGARIFNAAAALGLDVRDLVAPADSVTFCLSKGLGAPVGSVLCGSKEFIEQCRRLRKMVGGGTRQAGILAAAGIYALDHMVERLPEDHRRARVLADGLAEVPGVRLDLGSPYTNMVFVEFDQDFHLTDEEILARLAEQGVLMGGTAPRKFRLVTHVDIPDEGVRACIEAFKAL